MKSENLELLYKELTIRNNFFYEKSKTEKLTKSEQDEYNILEDQRYCIESYIEASKKWYEFAAKYIKKLGYSAVYDLGCCYGYQSEAFTKKSLDYIGIESCKYMKENMYNSENAEYIFNKYPCELAPKKNSIAISHLCVGFMITALKDLKVLYNQFDVILLDNVNEEIEMLYKRIEKINIPGIGEFYLYRKE